VGAPRGLDFFPWERTVDPVVVIQEAYRRRKEVMDLLLKGSKTKLILKKSCDQENFSKNF